MPQPKPWIRLALTVALLGAMGCDPETPPAAEPGPPPVVGGVQCRAKAGKVDLSWSPSPGAHAYRVSRATSGGAPSTVGETPGQAFADFQAVAGVSYAYTVTALGTGGDAPASAPCVVTAASTDGPDPVGGLACRAKDGKVDVTWDAVPGAAIYRVLRSGDGAVQAPIAETAGRVHADLALVNGVSYQYDVVAVDARGRASESSAGCTATPGPRVTGTAPPPVSNLACRGKNDKADLTWSGAAGAALYRVYRAEGTGAPTPVGETTGTVFASFGLALGTPYAFSVESVGPGGAVSARSSVCSVTPGGRGTGAGNKAPRISSQPLTTALEDHFYSYGVVATDPEGGAIAFSLLAAPPGMTVDPQSGVVSWAPTTRQIGVHPVEVRATDPLGAYASQAYLVDAADFDEPPVITSVPLRYARAGEPYRYDVDAYDPEGRALAFSFAAPVPEGVSIDPASGLVTWTPAFSDAGAPTFVVRASDPAGGFGTQTFVVDVAAEPLDLLQPGGSHEIAPGQTLRLPLVANYPRAALAVEPLPENAKLEDGVFEFTPSPGQIGDHDLGFQAILGAQRDLNPVTIRVRRANGPPQLAEVPSQQVREGESLVVPIAASDPDGDALRVTAPGLSLANALFDEIGSRLLFSPSFDQAGTYRVRVVASDARDSAEREIEIVVEDAPPPVAVTDLVIDPVKTPTFAPTQTITGSTRGEVRPGGAAKTPFIVGLAPVSVRQGRSAVVEVTGLGTDFAPGAVGADFGEKIEVQKIEVLSPTAMRVTLGARTDAPLGVRTVRVSQPGGDAASVVAFSVEPGAAQATGVLIDSFTQQPLAGVRVAVQGQAGVSAVTDAQGRFTLDGVPPGDQTLVVATPNYALKRIPLSFQPNAVSNLGDALGLDALARPFSAGGTLPRSASLASVLDRGVNAPEPDLDLDQARALVQDTLLAIGGESVGVLDEAGNQLNPNFNGQGFMSLTPAGVDLFARRLLKGDLYTLREIHGMIDGTLGWLFPDFSLDAVLRRMQRAVDLAWKYPSNPVSAEVIVLFNRGLTLDSKPPVVTPETRFNSFQAMVLVSGFLRKNFNAIDDALDEILVQRGLDPEQVLRQYGYDPQLAARSGEPGAFRRVLASTAAFGLRVAGELVFGREAFAADAPPAGPANSKKVPQPRGGLGAVWDALPAALLGAAFAGLVAFAIAGTLAVCGIFGASIATFGVGAALATFGISFLSALFAKLTIAYLTADQAIDLAPKPTSFGQARVDTVNGQEKLRLPFKRSPSEIEKLKRLESGATYQGVFGEISSVINVQGVDPNLLDYRYHLWQVKDPSLADKLGYRGTQLLSTHSQPVAGDPTSEQFVIPAAALKEGTNHLVVVAVQFYRRIWGEDPDRAALSTIYPALGVAPPTLVENTVSEKNLKSQLLSTTNGLIFKGTFESGFPEGFQQYKQSKEIAAAQARLQAFQQLQDDAQKHLQNQQRLATEKANEVLNLQTEVGKKDEALVTLAEQRKNLLADKSKLQSYVDWGDAYQAHLASGAPVQGSLADFAASVSDPASAIGQQTRTLLEKGATQAEVDAFVEAQWKVGRTLQAASTVEDAILELEIAKEELIGQVKKANATGQSLPVSSNLVEIPKFDGGVPPRLLEPGLFELPAVVNKGDNALVGEAVSRLETQKRLLESAAASYKEQAKSLVPAVEETALAIRRRLVSEAEERAIAEIQQKIDVEQGARSTLEQQRLKAAGEVDDLARLEQEALDKVKGLGAPPAVPTLPPKSNLGTFDFITTADLKKWEGISRVAPPDQYKFKVGAGDAFGVFTDLASEAFTGRDGILVLTSEPSKVISVDKVDGVVYVPSDEPLGIFGAVVPGASGVALARPLEIGPPQEEPEPRPLVAKAAAVMGDDGTPAGMEPLRWRRVQDAMRRGGLLPRLASNLGASGFPLSFEMDPDPANTLGLLHPTPPTGPTGKAGFLVRDFPFSAPRAEFIDAGFPSEVIAVDSRGAVYLENLNSNAAYGGRVFRYVGAPIERDHVGSLAYYSLTLQYARPTQAVAMEIGETIDPTYGRVENVFVAELDPGIYLDPNLPATNKILRLPTHQADLLPFYANGQNRNRLVGQPFATHPDFQMTGPSDLELDTRQRGEPSAPRYLYFSDEENVFVIRDEDKDGQGEVGKVVSIPGRRFSGLAVDTGGNLLFADYVGGELFALPSAELDVILASGTPIQSNEELDRRAYLLKPGLNGPGDVELDTWEQRYIVSTRDGFEAFDVPLVGRLTEASAEIRVDVTGRELPVTRRPDRGNVFIVGSGSERPFNKDVRLRVRRVDPVTGESSWISRGFVNGAYGVSVLPEPL